VLHLPCEDKKDDFKKALETKLENGDCNFRGAFFPSGTSHFSRTTFCRDAHFNKAVFCGEEANFSRTVFEGEADFSKAIFKGESDFYRAVFKGDADFSKAIFKGGSEISQNHLQRCGGLRATSEALYMFLQCESEFLHGQL